MLATAVLYTNHVNPMMALLDLDIVTGLHRCIPCLQHALHLGGLICEHMMGHKNSKAAVPAKPQMQQDA